MHFHEEYALPQWDPIQLRMLLAQKQVYTPSHTVSSMKTKRKMNSEKKGGNVQQKINASFKQQSK